MSDKVVKGLGTQVSKDDPFTFVMSNDSQDRMGDIVKQNWDLKSFTKNNIALWGHNSSEMPVGTWENVKVVGNQLIGQLKFAEKGTSEFIDTLRSLVSQGIIKAVSVGFVSHKQKPINKEQPWEGAYLDDNELFECSLCSIPANAEALIQATKSLNVSSDVKNMLSGNTKTHPIEVNDTQASFRAKTQAENKLRLLRLLEGS